MGCWPPDIAIFARPTPVSLVAWPFVNFKFRSGKYSWALLCLHNDYNPCTAKIIVKAKFIVEAKVVDCRLLGQSDR